MWGFNLVFLHHAGRAPLEWAYTHSLTPRQCSQGMLQALDALSGGEWRR